MKKFGLLMPALLLAGPAMAHHPLGGLPMETFAHGVLSGVGHPVLGFDHLFFVAVVGIAALFTGYRLLAPLAYIGAMLAGCALMAAGVSMPLTELFIAVSLLTIGGVVLSGRGLALMPALAIFAGFGLFHGSAFGAPLAAQEATMGIPVLFGYLIGLGVVQYAIAIGAGWVMERLLGVQHAGALNARLAGAGVAGIGVFLVLEAAEGPVLNVLFGV